ncbi:MAG: hypothetical protein QF362_02790 [Candidatus Woesearchaeota archaeon]|jgi:hypothetical protein|nr:hypothetical protein [Candidatus Woesearchaeota archaeon]MDP7506344.1 hypothetical protein [Candidatus Woesearchaeota archaeon]|tara:strand:- start:671 stop:1132 length:462 start_codon:yes stop_codon:yes gene_type:complete
MLPLTYILTLAVAYFGIVGGLILGKIAEEELKEGRKYFLLLQNILVTLALTFMLTFNKLNIILSSFIGIVVFLCLIYFRKRYEKYVPKITYVLFGFIFYFSSKMQELFIIESIVIFLYGLPTGSLDFKKKIVKILLGYSPFVMIGLVLYLVGL